MSDPIGRAIADFNKNGEASDIKIQTNYTEDELLSPVYFFRTEDEMPEIEKTALNLCRGKVLDVGAAAGCHALVLQKKGLDVTALEKSEFAARVMKKRGVRNVVCQSIFEYRETGFDTIFLLMNGTGIGGTLNGLEQLLKHLKHLMNPGGQILIDSSDIRYLFGEDDGSVWVDLTSNKYYGEMEYELMYKNYSTQFKWLFTDFETLAEICTKLGLTSKKILEGDNFDYLARISSN